MKRPLSFQEKVEAVVSTCPYCREDVTSFWTKRGCISSTDYVLIADWIFHAKCWDEQVEKNPP